MYWMDRLRHLRPTTIGSFVRWSTDVFFGMARNSELEKPASDSLQISTSSDLPWPLDFYNCPFRRDRKWPMRYTFVRRENVFIEFLVFAPDVFRWWFVKGLTTVPCISGSDLGSIHILQDYNHRLSISTNQSYSSILNILRIEVFVDWPDQILKTCQSSSYWIHDSPTCREGFNVCPQRWSNSLCFMVYIWGLPESVAEQELSDPFLWECIQCSTRWTKNGPAFLTTLECLTHYSTSIPLQQLRLVPPCTLKQFRRIIFQLSL